MLTIRKEKEDLAKSVSKSLPESMRKISLLILLLSLIAFGSNAQVTLSEDLSGIDYANPKEYVIGGITVEGVEHLDKKVLILLSGLSEGDKVTVPGDKITKALENLWNQGLFSDIDIRATKITGNKIFLEYYLQERPRLAGFRFRGTKKSEEDDIRDKVKLIKGKVFNENLESTTKSKVKAYFVDKGFLNTEVILTTERDSSLPNSVFLLIEVKKKKKVKINEIIFHGNEQMSDNKLKRTMKETKQKRWWNIFKASKFLKAEYKTDKQKIIAKYNKEGFRDAQILSDTIYQFDEKTINIEITLTEGKKYYFRNIDWVGNTKYSDEILSAVLGVKKGDIYNQEALETNLYMNQNGRDVSSLYLDDGYLFFNVTPVEVLVEGDSIDLEMRMYEGKQATINKVTVTGNTKTNDHVILREIRTKPGQLFSRADIIRSQRELANLGYFDPEKLQVNPKPNPADGTVDIEYVVEEKPSDQIELSGGWGAGRIVGTLGLSFNNFSLQNLFKKGAWRPLPAGDGQRLTLRAQSNGLFFQSYNFSFTEPWLGGKKPNSLSVNTYYSTQTNGVKRGESGRQAINIFGSSVGFGKRLKWPDDFFTFYGEVGYQNYNLENYPLTNDFREGSSNTFTLKGVISRNSIDQPIYPRYGSQVSLSLQLTPPFNAGKDLSDATPQEKYKWTEYHKWKFDASQFTKVAGNLVVATKIQFGFLGLYNRTLGITPFERFYLGGDGLSGFALDGRDIIALRGYGNNSVTPTNSSGSPEGGTIYNKYTMEVRYPISLNPSATIYVLGFAEAGNSWRNFDTFNPFGLKKSAGAGVRIFLPMFGLLGLDWGYGFDDPYIPGENGPQFHFSIGQTFQ